MTRTVLLPFLAFGLAAAPAIAQSGGDEMPADPVEMPADSVEVAIEVSPERARDIYREGLELYRADDLDGALLKYEESLVYYDAYAPAGLGVAQVLARQGRLEDARNAFEAAVAMAGASDASNAGDIQSAAQRGLDQVSAALTSRAASAAANAAAAEAQAGANAVAQKIEQATQMLSGNEITEAQGMDAYTLLEQARLEGYDTDLVAFYYAKALLAMDRAADAVPFAQTAVDAADPAVDNSALYIQLGLAHQGAGNTDAARAAYEAIAEGQAWHGWAQHYIGQLGS